MSNQVLNLIAQTWITIFSSSAIWLVGRFEPWKRWGYILGLLSQPAWFYIIIINKQWGIAPIAFFYTYSWCQGILNYWIKPGGE